MDTRRPIAKQEAKAFDLLKIVCSAFKKIPETATRKNSIPSG
jgi:hypothetical protein